MFLTFTLQGVQFKYGHEAWSYCFSEISKLEMQKKKQRYGAEKISFMATGLVVYYHLFFSDFLSLFLSIPLLFCFIGVMALKISGAKEFAYYVVITDKNNETVKIKIKERDKNIILKELYEYDTIQFKRAVCENR